MIIAVIGTGLMGGSLCKALKKYTDYTVYAYDTDKETSDKLIDTKSADKILNDRLLKEADMVFVCLKPHQTLKYIKENCFKFKKDCLVTDICGVKNSIADEISEILNNCRVNYLSCHPMAGREMSGFGYSDFDLFKGASMILIENKNCDKKYYLLLTELSQKIGFKTVVKTTAEEHDKIIAYTSQLAHAVSNAYIRSKDFEIKGFSAGSYQDMTRVSVINADMWSELMILNSENLSAQIDKIILKLKELGGAIKEKDETKLSALLKEGDILKKDELK